MRRARAGAPWIGSLVVHGALVGAALLLRSERAPVPGDEAGLDMVIDVADVVAEADVEAVVREAVEREAASGSGGGQPAAAAESRLPTRRAKARAEPDEDEDADKDKDEDDEDTAQPAAVSSASARIAAPAEASPGASSIGAGGVGGGIGIGIGPGSGTGHGPGKPAARPRPPPRSRARPARLVYPRRDREERPGEVFVVLLTVDEGGYVVGVRLQQGVNPDRDAKALDAVWRFHYDPALDRAGRPVKTRVVQRFMVE